uniref:Uncharacterized protein n=1 Tax=Lactuca sativa TaxID=4236 RepID=A0A9R1UXG7_LACSA|nr:hypothetical protein LSAT_V11C800429680 [Lactuca sativa]
MGKLDNERIRTPSPVVAHEVVTPIQIDVGEVDLELALTLYKSATPEFSRSNGWKHSKGASSCSRKVNLDWEGGEKKWQVVKLIKCLRLQLY